MNIAITNNEPTEKVTFRIAGPLLNQIDDICIAIDLSRSQFIRRCLAAAVVVETPDNDVASVRAWSPSLYERTKK